MDLPPDYRMSKPREIVQLPEATLEQIVAWLLQGLPSPKLTLTPGNLLAMRSLTLIATQTDRGLELESCDNLGEIPSRRSPTTEMDVHERFPILKRGA
jgi:hypothetical protein